MALVCCQVGAKGCKGCCRAMDTCCGLCTRGCSGILTPADFPSPLFPITSVVLNAAILIHTGIRFTDEDVRDSGRLFVWNIAAICIAVLNIIFAIYIYARFLHIKMRRQRASREGWKLFLYDVGVYLYIWVFLFQILWIVLGLIWSAADSDDRSAASTVVLVNFILLIVYCALCIPLLLCSLITECCMTPRWQRLQGADGHVHPQGVQGSPYAPPAAYQGGPPPVYHHGQAPSPHVAPAAQYSPAPQQGYAYAPPPVNALPPYTPAESSPNGVTPGGPTTDRYPPQQTNQGVVTNGPPPQQGQGGITDRIRGAASSALGKILLGRKPRGLPR